MTTLLENLPGNVHVHHGVHSSSRAADPEKSRIKIAYIGGGSREWAVKLMADLALSEKLEGVLALYDLDFEAARHNQELGEGIFSHPDALTKFQVHAVESLKEALSGADFVVISIEPGPVSLREADLEIPAGYGILQTVGDTTGPGGILRSLRSVPIYRQLAAAIMEECPEAWVINYTNPMAICTAALHALAPGIKAFGCCHEVFGTQKMLARLVAEWFEVPEPPRQEIQLDICGVNHFTFATQARWRENDLIPLIRGMIEADDFFRSRTEIAENAKSQGSWFASEGLVAYDLFRRFGALGAAGDRHLAEFVSWYLTSEAELHRWGVVATPFRWRMERSRAERPKLSMVAKQGLEPSGEEGVDQIEALLGMRHLVTNVNLPNKGQISWLPQGTIVETYANWGRETLRPLVAGEPPDGVKHLIGRAAEEQRLLLEASLTENYELAYQVLLTNPLVRIPSEKAREMFTLMLQKTMGVSLPG